MRRRSRAVPDAPCTWRVVLRVSIGVRIILKLAALRAALISSRFIGKANKTNTYHKEAKMVLIGEGRFFKYGFDWSKARIPALAAVSPNLESGPRHLSPHPLLECGFEKGLTLDKGSTNTLIVSPVPSALVECPSCNSKGSSETILIIHNRTQRLTLGQP